MSARQSTRGSRMQGGGDGNAIRASRMADNNPIRASKMDLLSQPPPLEGGAEPPVLELGATGLAAGDTGYEIFKPFFIF